MKSDIANYTAEAALRARKSSGLSQADFWRRLGVTQSGGSRYERGERPIPKPLTILMNIALRKNYQSVVDDIRSVKGS